MDALLALLVQWPSPVFVAEAEIFFAAARAAQKLGYTVLMFKQLEVVNSIAVICFNWIWKKPLFHMFAICISPLDAKPSQL